jgi:hypothetical protein
MVSAYLFETPISTYRITWYHSPEGHNMEKINFLEQVNALKETSTNEPLEPLQS